MKSTTLAQCSAKGHKLSRHSPDAFDIILECSECCMAWLVKAVTGEEIRLHGCYELRLTQQKRTQHILDTLTAALPEWHFRPYGSQGAVVGYPPHRPFTHEALYQNWEEISAHAWISSTAAACGYVITRLREKQ